MSDVTAVNRFGFVNAYLVREDDGLTLIDASLPGGAKKIIAAAAELGAPIVRIALTHAHGDHVGSLDALVTELGDVEVLISGRDARLLAKDLSVDAEELQRKPPGNFRTNRTQPTRTLTEGDRVGSLEVIATPGHTPGHVAYMDVRDRTLYCGDTFATLGGVSTSARPNPRFPLVFMGTWDRASTVQSATKLRALSPARLAPGHGKVKESPAAAMDGAIARAS
jgi:glyoxylase-like metal-dependent hydrolase (beta-lactamase superfamily II)